MPVENNEAAPAQENAEYEACQIYVSKKKQRKKDPLRPDSALTEANDDKNHS